MSDFMRSILVQRIFAICAWTLVPVGILLFLSAEFLGAQELARPAVGPVLKILLGLSGGSGAIAASILFLGMLTYSIATDRSPIWKRGLWVAGILLLNLVTALAYYIAVYRNQVASSGSA